MTNSSQQTKGRQETTERPAADPVPRPLGGADASNPVTGSGMMQDGYDPACRQHPNETHVMEKAQ
jgi:hypothetical protein